MLDQFFKTRESEIRFFFLLFIGLFLLTVSSYVLGARVERSDISVPTLPAAAVFPSVKLEAKSVYIYDSRTKEVIFAKNENERLPLASLTKVMAALVAKDLSPEYGTVTITQGALATEGDSGLFSEERWRLQELLDFSLVSSSNDGIHAVALALGALKALKDASASDEEIVDDFVRSMNKKAAELDLKNTYFWNETGLDESEVKGGAYGTAKDIAMLFDYVVSTDPGLLSATKETESVLSSLDRHAHLARNTNAVAAEIPGLIASKTGYTSTAGGNLAFAFDPEIGRPIIISILGSSADGRFVDALKLVNATIDYLNGESQ
jgi:serine-type D-Ala-D-Ala carboxypeptidase (penicillin-binding protein 5/6)